MARPTATDTRNRILDSAERCFIKQGFAATSMREIAIASETTNSLIVHHFESKAGLWEEVKERRMVGFVEQQNAILSKPELSIDQFADAIRVYFDLLRNDPELVQLLARAELEQDLTCSRFHRDLVTGFVKRIEVGQREGVFSQSLTPAYLLALILGAVTQWMETKFQFTSWNEITNDEDSDEQFLETIIEVLMHGVQGKPNDI